jgi:hypothetical protein
MYEQFGFYLQENTTITNVSPLTIFRKIIAIIAKTK